MPVARVNDIELNYKLEGDGEDTIVLINGLADDHQTWVLQMDDFLAAGYRVLRFDNRGIGASSKPAGPYTSRMLADDAKALADSLGITGFHLMGVQPLFHHRADGQPGGRFGAADLPDFNGGHGGHGEQPGAIRQHLSERRIVHHLHHPCHRHQGGVAVGVITILGYIIAFGGIYIFVGSYIVQNVFGNPHVWGLTQIVTIAYGVLVVAPVVIGLKFGVRVTVALYAFEVILLLVMSIAILVRGGHAGLSGTPFSWPHGSTDVLLTFSLAVLAFGGFEAAARWPRRPRTPGATCRSRSSAR
jgi:hypothetical protein